MIKIPEGINVSVDNHVVTVKGPIGELKKSFSKRVALTVEANEVKISTKSPALAGTIESIVTSMVKGVTDGYTKKLKVLYAHFPVSIEIKGTQILIKNFLGEKQPRKAALVGNTKIEVKGQNVTVSGLDKEAVGQTVANMRIALKIKERDARIFQDGIYEDGG
ncbi:50S ribosomal protein L6 [Candidatus Micrarchaeota archaeon]|nr:50S ribosomal protein L6 [Candidatus Micrarchaeota archaeon]